MGQPGRGIASEGGGEAVQYPGQGENGGGGKRRQDERENEAAAEAKGCFFFEVFCLPSPAVDKSGVRALGGGPARATRRVKESYQFYQSFRQIYFRLPGEEIAGGGGGGNG